MEVYLASAGTGKTHTLVERYLEALKDHPPYRLAAVTFTRAAASELAGRIRARLLAVAADPDHPLAGRARRYAAMVGAAPIGTIHGFFAWLLRLGGVWLELDPEFLRVEADEAQLLFDEEARSLLYERKGRPSGSELWDLVALYARRSLAERLYPSGPVSRARHPLFHEAWRRHEKRLAGEALGPTEIELKTLRLLDEAFADPDLKRRLLSRLRAVFVDEYQDTSPLQGRVFERLEALGVRLVVVGDPKQAIYAFRNADVEVFRRAMARARVHELRVSYRHARALVGFLNRLTRELAARGLGFSPREAPEVRPRPDAPLGRVVAVRVLGTLSLPELRRREAELLADWVAEEGGRRGFSQVAILVRSRQSFEDLRPALEARGVPYVFVGARGFFALREVRDLVQAARAALDPEDRLALAAFLRGPFGGLGLFELEEVIRAEDPLSRLAARWPEVHARLLRFAELAGRLDPVRFFEELARARVIDGRAYLERIPPRARANVDHLLFLLAGKRFSRLELLLRELEELRAMDSEAEVATGGREAVRVYTFHGAKGLEWPAVAVFDLGRGERREAERVYVEREGGRYALAGDPDYPKLKRSWDEREREEAFRLLYVALSRPREALYFSYSLALSAKGEPTTKSPLARVLEDLRVGEWPEVEGRTEQVERSILLSPSPRREEPFAPEAALKEGIAPGRLPRVTSPSALKGERTRHLVAEEEALLVEEEAGGLGRVVGTLVHAAIAANWGPERLDWLMRQEAAQTLTPAEREEVARRVAALLGAYRELLGDELPWPREEDYPELPFAYPLAPRERLERRGEGYVVEDAPVVEGVIDRLYRAQGTWYLEDYKTDAARGDLLAYAESMGYDFQLAVYAEVVKRTLGVTPKVRLVFLERKEVVELGEDLLKAALFRFDLA